MPYRLLHFVFAIALATAAASPASANDFDTLWARAAEQHADVEAHAYLRGLQAHALWKDGGGLRAMTLPHDKALLECVTAIVPTPSPVRLVFRLSKGGTVSHALSDQTGYVSECLANKVVGLRLPMPPHEDFLLCQRFERDGERSSVTPCGPAGWTEQCEQQGTTKRCRNEFKVR